MIKLTDSPYTWTSMTSAFGECEDHDIMVSLVSNGSVVWPVIGKIMNQLPFSFRFHHRTPHSPIRVVWRGYHLYVGFIFLIRSSITSPLIQSWTQNINLILVFLEQNTLLINSSNNHTLIKSLNWYPLICKCHMLN